MTTTPQDVPDGIWQQLRTWMRVVEHPMVLLVGYLLIAVFLIADYVLATMMHSGLRTDTIDLLLVLGIGFVLFYYINVPVAHRTAAYLVAIGHTTTMTIYILSVLLQDPSPRLLTDLLFGLFLGLILLLHKLQITRVHKVPIAVVLLGLALPAIGLLNQFYMNVATQAGMFVVLALGLNIVVGSAGLLDLGYIAFYAVGAYLWAIVSTTQGGKIFPDWEAWVAIFPINPYWFFAFLFFALVVGAITGVLLGSPVLRLRGDYLAIVTLGFGEVIRVLATNLDKPINITNGAQGIKSIGRPPLFFEPWLHAIGINVDAERYLYPLYFYAIVLTIVILMIIFVVRLSNSRIGRAWTAIREDETAAIAMGVPLVRMKLLAFASGASFAGVMGMIFASYQSFINPPTFDLIRSINILSMVILGGMGSVPGAIMGAMLVTLLNFQMLPRITTEMDRLGLPSQFDPAQYQRMIFGLLLILMAIFRPEGILPEDRRRQELHEDEYDPASPAGAPPPPPPPHPPHPRHTQACPQKLMDKEQ